MRVPTHLLPPARVLTRILRRTKRLLYQRRFLIAIVLTAIVFSQLTNPFFTGSIIKDPYRVYTDAEGNIRLTEQSDLTVRSRRPFKELAHLKNSTHIVTNTYIGSPKTKTDQIEGIIDEIHTLRFNPKYPYLISGDHFSVFYPRSLGIFYATALDPRTARSTQDWYDRQAIYLKSTAYALDVFSKTEKLSTTIVPIAPLSVTTVSIYALASDTLYSILYALDVMRDPEVITSLYPAAAASSSAILRTSAEADHLLLSYRPTLTRHLQGYLRAVQDPQTGLVRKDILLSGTKDITRRYGAFYDNVILWKTLALAAKLGLYEPGADELASLKAKILQAYWYEEGGYFLEDLSAESLAHNYYSSDWLIVLMTGFLDPFDPQERHYYERSLSFIRREGLDEPLGLRYQQENRAERAYLPVRLFARSYGGTAIWSHWGMEYIKALVFLAQATGNSDYLAVAKTQLTRYEDRMITYQGYPELYDTSGEMYSNLLYKSVRRTGWVVNFEQARLLITHASPTTQILSK